MNKIIFKVNIREFHFEFIFPVGTLSFYQLAQKIADNNVLQFFFAVVRIKMRKNRSKKTPPKSLGDAGFRNIL